MSHSLDFGLAIPDLSRSPAETAEDDPLTAPEWTLPVGPATILSLALLLLGGVLAALL